MLLTCGEGVMDAVEGDCVDRIHLLYSILLQSVTLESVFLFLHLQTWV